MSQLLLNETAGQNTPSAGKASVFVDTQATGVFVKGDDGRYYGRSYRSAIAAQGAGFSSDTYLTNSGLLLPAFGIQAQTQVLWRVSASKTAAGTATPVYTIRIGTAQTTSDTSRLALTGPAQTAVADIGTLFVMATVRSIGASTSAVIQGTAWWAHRGTAADTTTSGVGFANDTTGHVEGTSAGFDSTAIAANSYIGLSVNGGASAAWTVTQVWVEANW